MESILTSVKKMLGLPSDYEHFDEDIIMHINSVFMILHQIGVGPTEGFYIEDETATWADFLGDPTKLQIVKSYMNLKQVSTHTLIKFISHLVMSWYFCCAKKAL